MSAAESAWLPVENGLNAIHVSQAPASWCSTLCPYPGEPSGGGGFGGFWVAGTDCRLCAVALLVLHSRTAVCRREHWNQPGQPESNSPYAPWMPCP
jgi:hypothetical protein